MPLNGQIKEDISGKYKITKQDEFYYKQRFEQNEWKILYAFKDEEKKLSDFTKACYFVQSSPKFHFTQERFITLALKDRRNILLENELTITKNKEKFKSQIEEKDLENILLNLFKISLT